jgi:LPS-assembly protein
MHRSRITSAVLSLILYVAYGVRAEEPGLKLRMQPELIPYALGRDEPSDLFIDADHVEGHQDRELQAAGGVRLRKRGAAVFSDQLYLSPDQKLTATGHVRFEKEGSVVTGEQLSYDLNNSTGYIDKPSYKLLRTGARGDAARLVMENRDLYRIEKGTFTTCDVGDDDWFMRTDRLELDRARDIGVARDATVVFKGVPILYSPYLDFSLSGGRKSGLLPPVIGSTTQSGFEYIQPYYWNIAPNRDATIAPRLLAKRGVLMDAGFRYLEPDLGGEMRGEYLPHDREAEQTRYAYSWQHRQDFGNGFSGSLNLQGVSDNAYFTDLSDKIALTSLTNLPREANLFYNGDWWNLNTLVQRFQTLQDPLAPVVPPYARVPQITLNMIRPTDIHLDFSLYGQYSEFVNPYLLSGRREILYPSISAPFQTSYFYLTPKIGYNTTHYSFEDLNRPGESRNLPIYSVDSALTFERATTLWGRAFLQTLEPRLYYVYIPFRPQAQLPNYDTALADFNFAQIFNYNKYSGGDRINDANQVTAAVTSRLINPDSGDEQLRLTLGQRYFFKQQEISLTPGQLSQERSDLLAAVTGSITRRWFTDLGVQYNTNENVMERSDMTLRFQPAIGKMVNFGYHFDRDSFQQVDVSTQWPIGGRWTGLARYDYSLLDRRVKEGLLGVEYNAACWGARFVFHRFVSATQEYVNALFFQLELTGVSRIGLSPQELLRQNITGYTSTTEKRPVDSNPFPSY